jgi:hypothetical protein
MTGKKLLRSQRSGHCESGAVGGHGRCKYYFTKPGKVCSCTCHTPPKDEAA